MERPEPRVVALSGGVGGARLAHGLALALPAERLTVVVNTGDDFRLYGLAIAPDVDTVLYTLAERANPATGWGLAGDSATVMTALRALGDEAWFHLGDQDLATHLVRTGLLAAGRSPTEVTRHLAASLGVAVSVLPATDATVATVIDTVDGPRDFQSWFVRQGCRPPATALTYRGAAGAGATTAVLDALAAADLIVLGPSNPYLSIGPMLALADLRAALVHRRAPVVAVSPVVRGQALKGPTAELLRRFVGASDCAAVASLYVDFLDGLVIDHADAAAVPELAGMGVATRVAPIVVPSAVERRRLAETVLAFGAHLAGTV